MIWNESRECISRDELAVRQGKHLVELVWYMYHNAGYYRKKMQKIGIEPGDIRGIEDLNKLPFTTKEDLLEAYPYGVYAVPNSKIVRYHASDNMNRIDAIVGYTQNDLDIWSECMARSMSMAGLGKNDVIQITFDYGLCTDGLGAHYGAEKIGAAVIPTSVYRISALIEMMRKLHVTGIIGTPAYLMRVAQMVEEKGLKNSLRLKTAICGGEPWTERTRKKMQDKLGIKICDIYGLNELTGLGVACECECQKGMHVQEDFFLVEILDTNTLLAVVNGTFGELVFTSLQRQGIPLIRYRTMNITRINYEKCECGRTTARIDRISEEVEEILLIRGNSVFIFKIEAALSELQDIEGAYIVYIRKEHSLDVVDVYIESDRYNEGVLPDCGENVKYRVANALSKVIGMMPSVHFSEGQTIQHSKGRKVTIVDKRRFL